MKKIMYFAIFLSIIVLFIASMFLLRTAGTPMDKYNCEIQFPIYKSETDLTHEQAKQAIIDWAGEQGVVLHKNNFGIAYMRKYGVFHDYDKITYTECFENYDELKERREEIFLSTKDDRGYDYYMGRASNDKCFFLSFRAKNNVVYGEFMNPC